MIGFIPPFRILDYLDRLNVVKTTTREYHCTCPVCESNGFKIDKKTGKYYGFICGCDVKDIREAVRPWSEVRESQTNNSHQPKRKKANRKSKSAKSKTEIKLALLPEIPTDSPQAESGNVPNWLQKQGVPAKAVETRYWYSKSQWVSRFEWQTPEGKEKRSEAVLGVSPMSHRFKKTIRQGHIKSNGLIQWQKGGKDWLAYKLTEVLANCADKWVLGVEGEGCVETAREKAIASITWQGSNWQSKNITADLTKLINSGAAGLIYFGDRDSAGEKKAELIKSVCESINFPCLILSPTDVWADMPDKGDITDWVNAYPHLSTSELISKLSSAAEIAQQRNEQEEIEAEEQKISDNLPIWSQSDIADYLAEKYQGQLAWNTDLQEWYRYSLVNKGIWGKGSTEKIGKLIKSEIGAIAYEIGRASKKRDNAVLGVSPMSDCRKKKPTYTISFVNGVIALLKLDLEVDSWDEAEGLLPLLNGVLDLETRKLLPHSPENRLTWCLPYEYNMFATCEPIQEWLLTMCGGDRDLVQLMRAYLLGVVTGRTDWQKYLELIGAGGTGKSTFTRLAIALVGIENVHTTTLHKLEKSKFEPASIAGKRLVLINDSEKYASDVSRLKNLTGQDSLPFEQKFKQSKGGFTPSALVIVSTNEVILSSDYTSGLLRRRISVPMNKQIKGSKQKNLIEQKNGQMSGEFLPYIPGLLNWVLEMDEERATSIVKNYEEEVPSLLAMKARTLVETNPIADWLNNNIVYNREAKTNIGVAKRDTDSSSPSWYLDTDKWLYANYKEHSHSTGTNAVSLRRFVALLSDLGQNQLGLDIRRERDREGSYFVGLKIRTQIDLEPPMITGNTKVIINTKVPSDNTNVISKLWTMVMDKVTDMIDYVTDESIGNDECPKGYRSAYDDCDGKNEKYNKLENNVEIKTDCNTNNEDYLENSEINNEFSKMPSQIVKEDAQIHIQQEVTDSQSTITVGDKVIIEDCPGHWASFSPFTVEAIGGEMAKLEMVSQLVEIKRLSVIDG